ncbi:MAG: hypothetical protein ABNH53_02445 [Henriciella sp.]|jgi:pimeloyl-ACP methyl ester carboxylesterase/DNA-binding CsgD family transcriptional regulator
MNEDHKNDLIKMAYAMVVEPQRLEELDRLLGDRLSSHYQDESDEPGIDVLLDEVAGHFEHALDLFERQQGNDLAGQSVGQREGVRERKDWILIESDGTIRSLGDDAAARFGIRERTTLPSRLFERREYGEFLGRLRSAAQTQSHPPIVFKLENPSNPRQSRYVLRWDGSDPDGPVGLAVPLNLHWTDRTGRAFGRAFDLTGAELSISRALINGTSLRELADERHRSIATIRNQTKGLLAKLNLSSQSELISLYSGFSKISELDHLGKVRAFSGDELRSISELKLPNGMNISYDVFGEDDARPVLFLHPMFGGTGLTQRMKEAVLANNLKLIMPWRPYYGDTDGQGEGLEMLLTFADNLPAFLDHFGVASCPLLAANGATPLAFAALKQHAERFTKVVLTGANVPLTRKEQFWAMGYHQRVPLYLARHAPKLVEMYIRSVIAKLDAGYDEAYGRRYFSDCSIDLETLLSAEYKQNARDALSYTYINSYKSSVQELVTNSMDWSELVTLSAVPIDLFTGEADTVHNPAMVRPFVDEHENMTLHVVKNAASLIVAQKPELIFAAL